MKPKILMITPHFPPVICGVGDYTFHLAMGLAQGGARIGVVTAGQDNMSHARCSDFTITHIDGRWNSLTAMLKIWKEVVRFNPDVISIQLSGYGYARHGVAVGPFFLGTLVRLARKRHLSVTCHELYLPMHKRPKLFLLGFAQRFVHTLLCTVSDSVVVNTLPYLVEIQHIPWLRKKAFLIPNPSNIPARLTSPGKKGDRLSIGAFGLFAPAKQYEIALEAFSRVHQRWPNTRFVFIGDNTRAPKSYLRKLEQIVHEKGLEPVVHWTGPCGPAECSKHLAALDIFILPQPDGHLTRSTAFMAAAAHGLPVVAALGEDQGFDFADRENIIFARPGDPQSFMEGLEFLIANPVQRRRIGASAKELYDREFSWETALLRYRNAWGLAG